MQDSLHAMSVVALAAPRRMWADSPLELHATLRLGDTVARNSTVADVSSKQGRSVNEVEGYPGLVVSGPLIATLLLDRLHRHAPEDPVPRFHFEAPRPTFDLHPFSLDGQRKGRTVRLWAQDHECLLSMDALATLQG